MFTFIDLFSGIGGFRIPLEKLGGKCVGFSEIDTESIKVYKDNFITKNEIELGDITRISSLPKVDVLVGGVPCQSWSVAGKKKGFNDSRGKLWFDTFKAVHLARPEIFIFENVKGLADPKHRDSFLFIIKKFNDLGYNVYTKILNAYDFGLPQNRERVFIVGLKKDSDNRQNFLFPKPLNKKLKLYEFLDNVKIYDSHLNKKSFNPYDIFGKKIPLSRNKFQKINYLNDFFIFCDTRAGHSTIHSWDLIKTTQKEEQICLTILKNRRKKIYGEADGNPISFSDLKNLIPKLQKKDLIKLVNKGILCDTNDMFNLSNTKNSSGLQGVYRVFLPQSDIFSTLTATGTNDFVATRTIPQNDVTNYRQVFLDKIYYPGKYRSITPIEASRLQGFSPTFKLHKNKTIAMKQLGNAVPTTIVYHLMKSILDYYLGKNQDKKNIITHDEQLSL